MIMDGIIIKITPDFEKKAKKLLSMVALEKLYDYLELNPEAGAIIRGTSGIRKLRWGVEKKRQGKRGGVRVLYHYSKGLMVLLITLYEKSNQETITEKEKNTLKKALPILITKYLEDL